MHLLLLKFVVMLFQHLLVLQLVKFTSLLKQLLKLKLEARELSL
jgi:hypothetical protein